MRIPSVLPMPVPGLSHPLLPATAHLSAPSLSPALACLELEGQMWGQQKGDEVLWPSGRVTRGTRHLEPPSSADSSLQSTLWGGGTPGLGYLPHSQSGLSVGAGLDLGVQPGGLFGSEPATTRRAAVEHGAKTDCAWLTPPDQGHRQRGPWR